MILYLDTSALVKLYAEEEGSKQVRDGVRAADLIATSLIAYAETRAALARKGRSREVSRSAFTRCRRDFERDWQRLNRLPIDELLVRKAGELAEQHALRALDALHLASADSLQTVLQDTVTFACFDGTLNRVAAARGFALLMPSLG